MAIFIETEEKKQNKVGLQTQNIEKETVKNLKRKRIQIPKGKDTQSTFKETYIDVNETIDTVIFILFSLVKKFDYFLMFFFV